MHCPYGVISNVYSIGINPKGMKDKDTCIRKADNKVCSEALNKDFITALVDKIKKAEKKEHDFSSSFTY